MSVGVVVVTYESEATIGACLRSLLSCGEVGLVVVVDNASSDQTKTIVSLLRSPRVRLLENAANEGFARACNRGAREVPQPLIAFVNPDVVADPACFRTLTAALDTREVLLVAPRLMFADGSDQRSCRRLPTLRDLVLRGSAPAFIPEQPCRVRVPQVSGAFMLLRRADFVSVGGFDDRFPLYFEDVALCRAIAQRGGAILFVGDAVAVHAGGVSAKRDPAASYVRGRVSRVLYARLVFGLAPGVLVALAVCAEGLVRWLPLGPRLRGSITYRPSILMKASLVAIATAIGPLPQLGSGET